MCNLFDEYNLIEDFAEYLNEEEEHYDINCDDSYIQYIDNFLEGIYYEDLERYYIDDDIDGIQLFVYIRDTCNDIIECITEYMKDDEINYFRIREKLVKYALFLKLRDVEEKVKDMYIDKYINSEKKRLDCNP